MDILEALNLIETDYVETDIKALSEKDRLNFWISLKEFQQPKIMRTNYETKSNEEFEIEINYSTKPYTDIPRTLDKPKEN